MSDRCGAMPGVGEPSVTGGATATEDATCARCDDRIAAGERYAWVRLWTPTGWPVVRLHTWCALATAGELEAARLAAVAIGGASFST